MRLANWSSVWFDGEFSPERGTVRSRLLMKGRKELPGFFAIERPIFGLRIAFALYQVAGTLFFQAGSRRWALSQPGLKFHFKVLPLGLLSCFKVLENERVIWQITYLHLGRTFSSAIDPTYDALEFENDHFLSFVAETALNPVWQENVRRDWSAISGAV